MGGICWCVLTGESAGQDSCLYLVLASVLGNVITSSQLRNYHLHMVLACISFDLMTTYDGFLLRGVCDLNSVVSGSLHVEVQKNKQIGTLMPSYLNLNVDMRNVRFTQDLVLYF